MDKDSNLHHWEQWAKTYGSDLLATTKCKTIKRIEIETLSRRIRKLIKTTTPKILEVGCGNGFNLMGLAQSFPQAKFYGVDFSPQMVESARSAIRQNYGSSANAPVVGVLDARQLSVPIKIGDSAESVEGFDIVFTDRMLINLASAAEQLEVMKKISGILVPGGHFCMLENSLQAHTRLNQIRNGLGLPFRPAAPYNVFIDDSSVIEPFKGCMTLVQSENVSGLHDLFLYAVSPSVNGGQIDYDTPLMKALTDAILIMDEAGLRKLDSIGQNVLWIWR